MGKAKLNEGEMPEALAARPKGGGKLKGTSQARRRQVGMGMQHIRRRRRLERHLNELERKAFRMTQQGRSTAGIEKAIDQARYAIDHPHVIQGGSGGLGGGKKAPLDSPETFAPPHTSPPGFWTKHQYVHGRLARTLGVPEGTLVSNVFVRNHSKTKSNEDASEE